MSVFHGRRQVDLGLPLAGWGKRRDQRPPAGLDDRRDHPVPASITFGVLSIHRLG